MEAYKSKHHLDSLEKHDVENGPQLDIQVTPALPEPDRHAEKQLVHKLDWRLAPLFAALYFIAYLDRSNIGNAAVAGLTTSLGLTGPQYSTAVSVFFATYVPLEIPIVLAMQKIGPHRAIALMCVGWSVVTIGTAFVRNFGDLVAVRVLLGVTEAGFFPTLSLYISMVYKKEEQVRLPQTSFIVSMSIQGLMQVAKLFRVVELPICSRLWLWLVCLVDSLLLELLLWEIGMA